MPAPAIDRNALSGLIPEETAREIIQGAVTQSAVLSMGRRLPNMSSKTMSMNVLDMLPVAYFVEGDTGFKQTTKMAWDRKRIVAEEIAVIVPIPESVLDDSDYDVWGEVTPRLQEAAGALIDGAILFGVNKPVSWRSDVLATATAAGNVIAQTADIYADIMGPNGVIAKVEEDGYLPTSAVSAVKMRGQLRGMVDKNGQPLFKSDMQGTASYALDGIPMSFPMNGAFDPTKVLMIVGDFSNLVYSIRQDITFKIFTEGIVQDPATKDIAYNLMQQDMVALRMVMRLGWEIPNPINAYNATNRNGSSPFAAYTPANP